MTSHITVGLNENRKNSSRGSRQNNTDILNLGPDPNADNVRPVNRRNMSSITEGTSLSSPAKVGAPAAVAVDEEPVATDIIEPDAPTKKTEPPAVAPPRVRVPPGGFSAGFW